MKWQKLGRIYTPPGQHSWGQTHASNPVVEVQETGIRVYFTTRNAQNQAHISYIELDPLDPATLRTAEPPAPLLAPGPAGYFDDSGTTSGCLLRHPFTGELWLYYLGWNLPRSLPFFNTIGAARWEPAAGRFERLSPAPVLSRNRLNPISFSYPYVRYEGGRFRMWYGTHEAWREAGTSGMIHRLKHASSADGLHWVPDDALSWPFVYPEEYAVSRPCVQYDDGVYKLWFSFRAGPQGDAYRIGYAESSDGYNWQRKDEAMAGLQPGAAGAWDCQMLCYPEVFDYHGRRYMLYNGNGYGKTGLGLAVLEP